MYKLLPKSESENRIKNIYEIMSDKEWDNIIITNRIHQYYFTGTLQDSITVINKNKGIFLFVKRDFERAKEEATINNIYKINSFKDILKVMDSNFKATYIDYEKTTLMTFERLKKYLTFKELKNIDGILDELLSVKSDYEVDMLIKSGKMHNDFYDKVPKLLKEGMSEHELQGLMYNEKIKIGNHGLVRFSNIYSENIIGQFGFGVNSLKNTNHDGPGGMKGLCALVPVVGSDDTFLKKGDLLFLDTGVGYYGYQTDKTRVYLFNAKPTNEMREKHLACMEVLENTRKLLKPGNIPHDIYNEVMNNLPSILKENFMGFKDRTIHFLGHGTGLYVGEPPIIANKFYKEIKENMIFALEPKVGIENVGMVGVEETFHITKDGAKCITGGAKEIVEV